MYFFRLDTSYNSVYFSRLAGKNVLNSFTLEYFDKNRNPLNSQYKSFEDFKEKFQFSPEDDIRLLLQKEKQKGVKYDENQFNKSKEEMLLVLKGLVATNIWQTSEYFQIINENDKVIEKALK